MKITRNAIDSDLLGEPVLEVAGYEEDFESIERQYVSEFRPRYVVIKVPMEDLRVIHRLQSHGFDLLECQLRRELRLLSESFPLDPYRYEAVTREEDLAEVLEIAGTTFTHDRATVDPFFKAIGRPEFGGERYRRYVMHSFREPDQFVYRLVSSDGDVLAFGTHRRISADTVQRLLVGVKPECKGKGLGRTHERYLCRELYGLGYRTMFDYISAINYRMLKTSLGSEAHITQASAVLRKIYQIEQ